MVCCRWRTPSKPLQALGQSLLQSRKESGPGYTAVPLCWPPKDKGTGVILYLKWNLMLIVKEIWRHPKVQNCRYETYFFLQPHFPSRFYNFLEYKQAIVFFLVFRLRYSWDMETGLRLRIYLLWYNQGNGHEGRKENIPNAVMSKPRSDQVCPAFLQD